MKSRRRCRVLRPVFEGVVMVTSLVAGLGLIGSCATVGTGFERGLSVAASLLFSVVLVGGVFLFATMSRDLRLLRERMTDSGDTEAREQRPAAGTPASGTDANG